MQKKEPQDHLMNNPVHCLNLGFKKVRIKHSKIQKLKKAGKLELSTKKPQFRIDQKILIKNILAHQKKFPPFQIDIKKCAKFFKKDNIKPVSEI